MQRLVMFVLTMLLAGCSLPLSPPPADVTHTLTLAPDTPVPTARLPGVSLQVAAPGAAPGYATSAMAYRKSPHELLYYARHRWVDRPARFIGQALEDGLSAAGVSVLAEGAGARPDYRLLSELLQLDQDFTQRPSQVRLAVRLQLVDVRQARVLGSHTVRLEQSTASDDPAGGVVAANALLAELVAEAVSFCVRLTAE
ncbi:MAG: ABC-type transport auxiliary lipoprotein family protein [Immundisolibacter sp.]|uniref:ABC-type transport auxiliary lipoprotein family protein n=1 Tax=Immundisolibacter sp. TaxID=1934948 RepID=UPI003EE110BD